MLQDDIASLRATIESELQTLASSDGAEAFRLKHLVRKGTIAGLFDRLREVPNDQKREIGRMLNELRTFAEGSHTEALERLKGGAAAEPRQDVTLPARRLYHGHEHPIMQAQARFEQIFLRMGFTVAHGPDIEDDYHNYEALNFAADHPARDMQDTFFVEAGDRNDILLRSHTSSVQIRYMEKHRPPIRAVMPGRVYRNEAVSARAGAEFHQLEGLYIDKGVTMAQLKGTLVEFVKAYFGREIEFRFRPSFFPFTEPSAEMDITCLLCKGAGCRVCKNSGWLEIGGCGMVHPNVLRNCGIDPEIYSGYAFGMGIERTLMLKLDINDIRLLYENDARLLEQF
jgi:phenylalanyl-tRNA synthetase alpha chain